MRGEHDGQIVKGSSYFFFFFNGEQILVSFRCLFRFDYLANDFIYSNGW